MRRQAHCKLGEVDCDDHASCDCTSIAYYKAEDRDVDKEWITAWAYWDYNGQEYVEWTDREILLNIGKLMRSEAHAAPETISFHQGRLERMLAAKYLVDNYGDRYTKLPEWVERESREYERG